MPDDWWLDHHAHDAAPDDVLDLGELPESWAAPVPEDSPMAYDDQSAAEAPTMTDAAEAPASSTAELLAQLDADANDPLMRELAARLRASYGDHG